MNRKPSDPVKTNLRFTEALRSRLEKAATKNNRSMNEEIIRRLEASFAKEDRRQEFDQLADRIVTRIGGQGDGLQTLEFIADRIVAKMRELP